MYLKCMGWLTMGAFSRAKGSREERALVQYLNENGYEARRVPLSGSMVGFKHDVIAYKDGAEYTFENKSRSSAFKGIYALYHKYRGDSSVVRYILQDTGEMVSLGTDFEAVKQTGMVHFQSIDPINVDIRTFRRIRKLDALRAGADFLVIKDNHSYRLFVKFWS